jgi:hypothetical protein
MRRCIPLLSLLLTTPLLLGSTPAPDPLDHLKGMDLKVAMNFERQPLPKILTALGAAAGIQVETDAALADVVATVVEGSVVIREVLSGLAERHGLVYEAPSADKLVVRRAVEERR